MVDIKEVMQEIKQSRDELALHMHLASLEIREEWDEPQSLQGAGGPGTDRRGRRRRAGPTGPRTERRLPEAAQGHQRLIPD